MNQLEYIPGIGGASVQMDGPTSFVGIAENLRSREWEYSLGYRDLVSATRPAREVDVNFYADYATADDLRRVADADVTARTPGVFIAQKEWRQRGYILASKPSDIHFGRLSTELKVSLLDGAWWRLVSRSFVAEDTTPEYRSATGKSVTTTDAANVPLHTLTVDGESVQDGTPTPDAPVDVQVVQGVNLLNPNSTEPIFVNANNGSISVLTGGYSYVIPCEASTTYTFARKTAGTDPRYIISETAVYPAIGGTATVLNNQTVLAQTFATTASAKYLILFVNRYTGGEGEEYQLVKGSTALPYMPYGSIGLKVNDTITPIGMNGNVLASLPDGTKDVLTVDSVGHVVLEKHTKYRQLRTTDTINLYTWNNKNGVFVPNFMDVNGSRLSGLCNVATCVTDSGSAYPYPIAWLGVASNALFLIGILDDLSISTVDEFKTWLADHQVYVYYPLTTPQTIDLGYIEMPSVSDGSVVSITAEVTPTITAEWQTSPDLYLDYPHDYQYDYQKTSYAESITPSVLTPSDVHLVIYGPAVNPYVIVGGNRYQVNVTVPSNGYVIVDGRDKTIQLTLADGTVQNVFSSGVRGGGAGGGTYVFEKIPAGTSEVTYDGSFGFDLGWYEEEGEPPWNQS